MKFIILIHYIIINISSDNKQYSLNTNQYLHTWLWFVALKTKKWTFFVDQRTCFATGNPTDIRYNYSGQKRATDEADCTRLCTDSCYGYFNGDGVCSMYTSAPLTIQPTATLAVHKKRNVFGI